MNTKKGTHRKTRKRDDLVGIHKTPTKRCCSVNTHFPERMKYCESTLHTLASYVGSPKILDFAFTRDIADVSEARVHSDIQTTDHAPISIKVNGLIVVSWNLEGLCNKSKRKNEVKEKLKDLLRMFSKPVIFLFQELFLQKDLKHAIEIKKMAESRMGELLEGYTFLSDGYTGCIAIPSSVLCLCTARRSSTCKCRPLIKYDDIRLISRPDKSGKQCMSVTITYNGRRFNIVNIHLKSIVTYPITGKQLHRKEMQNIIAKTNGPTLFMGDFNTDTPEQLF